MLRKSLNIIIFVFVCFLNYIILLKIGTSIYLSALDVFPKLNFSNFIMLLPRYSSERTIFGVILIELIIFSICLFLTIDIYVRYIEKLGVVTIFKLGKKKYVGFLLFKTIIKLFIIILLLLIFTLLIKYSSLEISLLIAFIIRLLILSMSFILFLLFMIIYKSALFSIISTAMVYGLIAIFVYIYFKILFSYSLISLTILLLILFTLNLILVKLFKENLMIKEIEFI